MMNNQKLLKVNNNPQLNCFPHLEHFDGTWSLFDISNTGITCFPNTIQHSGAIPAIDTFPICNIDSCNYFDNVELLSNQSISIYPNPATDKLTLEIPSAISLHQIEITDALGRVVQSIKWKVQSHITTISVSDFPSGVYFIKVQLQDGSATIRKFVKE